MRKRSSIRSVHGRDENVLAKDALDAINSETDAIGKAERNAKTKNPAAVYLGRLGGLKGGKARAAKLSKSERSEIARKAALARWSKE
jgi:hypothetical protein